MPLTVAVPRERRDGERRVALVPAAVSRLLARRGVAVRIEHDCGREAGFRDGAYEGVNIAPNFAAVLDGADIVTKVGVPTLAEIAQLTPGSLLVTLTRAFRHLDEIAALAERGITTVAMDLVPRTARARSMDALSSQATVAGYKAALLAAELSSRLFPMMTTAAGTIRPSRVVVIGAGVAGLQAIATARRLGAEVEAYDIRGSARERIESLGARMIDTGVEGTDAAGHARALRRDERVQQHDILAERLSRAHAVICAASIPNRPAPTIVTADMVERMLPDTVIVDMAAATGGNCELTRPGEYVRHGDTLIVGPLNLPSHGALHASEMYARNVTNMLELMLREDGTLVLDRDDAIVARCVLTHEGEVCHAATAESMGRAAHAFGGRAVRAPTDEDEVDDESGWVSEAPGSRGGVPSGATASGVGEAVSSPDGPDRERDGESEKGGPPPAAAADHPRGPDEAHARDAGTDDGPRDEGVVEGGATPDGHAGHGGRRDDADVAEETEREAGRVHEAGAARGRETPAGGADDGAPSVVADDLTAIDGIGPALQGRLYAFGITRLEMLATLDGPGRQRLAVQLELDEEIERADWTGQARALLAASGRGE